MSEMSPISAISAFRILELPINSSEEDVVNRSDLLSGKFPARSEEFRHAREGLQTIRRDRLRNALLEFPGASYGGGEWEAFCKKFERNPVGVARFTPANQTPGFADFDWKAFLRLAIEERISSSPADINPAIRQAPFSPGFGPPPLKIYDTIFG